VTEVAGKRTAKRGFPWRKAVQSLLSFAVVAAIFGFAVPKFASYGDVWPILAGLSAAQAVWLVLAQFLSRAAYWSVYMAALPGLRFWPSAVLIQTNSAVASVLPAGGAFAVGITYEMLGSWGFSNASITELIGVSGIWNFGVKLTMPTVSVLLLLATGVKSHPLVVAAVIGLAVCLVAGVAIGCGGRPGLPNAHLPAADPRWRHHLCDLAAQEELAEAWPHRTSIQRVRGGRSGVPAPAAPARRQDRRQGRPGCRCAVRPPGNRYGGERPHPQGAIGARRRRR
jgi:hypothetical protein